MLSIMLSIVPIHDLWVEANYRETQISRMKVSDPVRIDVDTYPGRPICAMSKQSCRPRGRSLRWSHPTMPPAISQRSHAVSRCASASVRATPTPLSPVPACQWKRPSRFPHSTMPLPLSEAIGWTVRSIHPKTWSSGRSPSCPSILDWAALVLRAPPAQRSLHGQNIRLSIYGRCQAVSEPTTSPAISALSISCIVLFGSRAVKLRVSIFSPNYPR